MAFSLAGIVELISTEPIINDKVISDAKFTEIKSVFETKNIDMNNGLDIKWKETGCLDVYEQEKDENDVVIKETLVRQSCTYELFKENLFNGSAINVSYEVGLKDTEKQVLLENAIQARVDEVKIVFENRANKDKVVEEKQEGTTTMISEKIKSDKDKIIIK